MELHASNQLFFIPQRVPQFFWKSSLPSPLPPIKPILKSSNPTQYYIIYLYYIIYNIFKRTVSAPASEFCEWVQVGVNLYIPGYKYQVKPHSWLWFSGACVAFIVPRNHFFCLYQQNKSSESEVKFRQTSNCCKRLLEAAKLAYATKAKESITSQRLGSQDFW